MNTVTKLESESTVLPDCIISHIFSLLNLKNLVKTSALSKQWYHEWGFRKDLNFDLQNMFDYNTIPELPKTLPLFQHFQCQFATRLDYFMQKYPGVKIRSIRINFPLGVNHGYSIDRWIHKGLVKGANRIELLFANETDFKINKYRFVFPFFFGPNSLTYLHLQNCSIEPTMDFSGLKNLKTLVLTLVPVEQNLLQDLCFNCIHLENFTFKECKIKCDMKIIGAKLRHLRIIDCHYQNHFSYRIEIDALNLSSFEYMGHTFMRSIISLEAPKLSKVFWDVGPRMENIYNFDTIARLHLLEDLTMNMGRLQISELRKDLVRFQHLRQLKLFLVGAYKPDMDYFWILDIAMASPRLQKLSLTIENGHTEISHMVGSQRQRREYVRFFHNGLKYVELHGCVCSINVIELASHLLRSATLLKQIIFSSCHNYYIGAGRWTMDSDGCCWFERNLIHEHLKNEVNEHCQLITL